MAAREGRKVICKTPLTRNPIAVQRDQGLCSTHESLYVGNQDVICTLVLEQSKQQATIVRKELRTAQGGGSRLFVINLKWVQYTDYNLPPG